MKGDINVKTEINVEVTPPLATALVATVKYLLVENNVGEKQAHTQFSFLTLFFKFSTCCENEIFKTLGKKTI